MRVYRSLVVLVLLLLVSAMAEAAPPPHRSKPGSHPAYKKLVTQTARPAASAPTSAEAIPLLNKGIAANQQGQYAQAEQYFRQAMTKMGSTDANWLVAYHGMANLYYRQHQYQQALPWEQKALPLVAKRHGANSEEEADALYFLGNIQYFVKNTAAAEALYKRAVAIFELPANLSKKPEDYTGALHNWGVIEMERNNYDAGLALYKKALAFKQKIQDPEIGSLLESIGIVYQNQQKTDEAINYYQQALAVYEKAQKSDSPEAKRVYFKLANLRPATASQPESASVPSTGRYDGRYYEAGKKAFNETDNYPEAVKQFKLALAQANQFYPDEKNFIATLQYLLGQSLYLVGSEEAGEPYLEKALAYQQANLPAKDPATARTHAVLGNAYKRKSEYELAEKHLRTALSYTPKGSDMYYSWLSSLAEVYCHVGRFEEARGFYNESLNYYQHAATPNQQAIKSVQYQLTLLDKMFRAQSQGLAQYFEHTVAGLRRWHEGPIQIMVNSGQPYSNWNERDVSLVQKAFLEWQKALGNQVQFQFTDNPQKTDVVVNWTDKPLAESDVDAQVGVHKLQTARGSFLSSEIILVLAKEGKPRTPEDIYATALHEIGHMLGLSHSANLSDIMAEVGNYSYSSKSWPTLSARDIQAAQVLYQQKPSISNPQGITLAEYQQFNQIATEGIDLLKAHSYRRASEVLENARMLYANDPYVNFYSGLSAFQAGDYKEAREVFENLVMPESAAAFSVDGQLGLVYVELGHKYNKWGKKNKEVSTEFYDKGVQRLKVALQNQSLPVAQREYMQTKLQEGQMRHKPEPVYEYNFSTVRFGYGFTNRF